MGGLWSVLCWAFLVAQTLFFIWMFHKFLFHSYSSFSKFAIQIRNSDDIFSGLLFWFFEVLIPTQVSSLPSLLHWEKKNLLCENHCTYLWQKYFWKSRVMEMSTGSWSAWLRSAGNKLWAFHRTELNLGSLGIWTDRNMGLPVDYSDHLVMDFRDKSAMA